jgi:hypothetical protein
MKQILSGQHVRAALAKLEPLFGGLQFVLSCLAILLVTINELLPQRDVHIPWLNWDWGYAQNLAQMVTWVVFVGVFVVYALASGRAFKYARAHWVELVVCLTWIPFTEGVVLRQLHSLLSLQTLVLIGSVAHVIRVARWTQQRFNAHPIVVLCAAAAILVTAGSAVLMQVEPQTFSSFPDSAWYVLTMMFTVGAPIAPTTMAGRLVSAVIITLGVGHGAMFVGTVSRMISQRLFKSEDATEKLRQQVEKNNQLLEENNRLLREVLQATRRAAGDRPASGEDNRGS